MDIASRDMRCVYTRKALLCTFGCKHDVELLTGLGFQQPSRGRVALHELHPLSGVLDLPKGWAGGFMDGVGLVLVQALEGWCGGGVILQSGKRRPGKCSKGPNMRDQMFGVVGVRLH